MPNGKTLHGLRSKFGKSIPSGSIGPAGMYGCDTAAGPVPGPDPGPLAGPVAGMLAGLTCSSTGVLGAAAGSYTEPGAGLVVTTVFAS